MAKRAIDTPLGSFELAYELTGPIEGDKVLMLHGWGANKELMLKAFGPHAHSWRTLYLDLPGFGKSSEPKEGLDSEGYLQIVRAFLAAVDFDPKVVVGHSFGGKIATLLEPELLVLLASAGIPKTKSLRVRLKIALAKVLRPLKSHWVRKLLMTQDAQGYSEVMYATLKRVVDEDFSARFAARNKPTLICWGQNDTATPLASGLRLRALIPASGWFVFEGDHFFFLSHAKKIVEQIENLKAP